MTRLFTEEWLAERKAAQRIGKPTPAQKAEVARTWNGNGLANCEVVDSLSGGVESTRTRVGAVPKADVVREAGRQQAGPLTPIYPLMGLCRGAGLPTPIPEYSFALPARRWRFDYAWPMQMLALEIDGGVWTQGRHNRGTGAIADQEKLSEAAILGWRVLYAIPDDLRTGVALDRLIRALVPTKRAA